MSGGTLVLRGGTVLTLDRDATVARAIALRGERVLAVGDDETVAHAAGPGARVIELRGRTVIPGLIDGHAHMDREGLKHELPSLAGLASIEALVARLRALAAAAPAGEWLVTMPLGDPPYFRSGGLYAEGRLPDRHDLDRAAADRPILIRSPWGYWTGELPLVAIANSCALDRAGIGRGTQPPTPLVEIERDAGGAPTGRIFERAHMPIAEFTVLRAAPNFTREARLRALERSMRIYNATGTTSVFEGHGVAPEVIEAYQRLRAAGRQTVRAQLAFSPGWKGASAADVRAMLGSWARWLGGRGLGDRWLRVAGAYTEIDESPEAQLRAACAPQTGWAGFSYDAGLPRAVVKDLLVEAARNGIRVCGIWANLIELYAEADRVAPIAPSRWVLGHQSALDAGQIARLRALGVVLTLHTNAHVYRRGAQLRAELGPERADSIVPLRRLLDEGVPAALSTDNVPPSLFHPIWQVVARRDRAGDPVAPGQAVSREEALRCATGHGAYLCCEEGEKGSLEPGKLADLVVLDDNPLTVDLARLRDLTARTTIVGGKVVYEAPE